MKKLALISILCLTVFTFVACSSGSTMSSSWADKETIVYEMTREKEDGSTENIGTLTTVLERNPDGIQIGGETYETATSIFTATYAFEDESLTVTALLDDFKPIASSKVCSTKERSYQLTAQYDAKYYNYELVEGENKQTNRIRVKGTYIDNELLYTYLRCSSQLSALSMQISIPDAFTGTAMAYSVTTQATVSMKVRLDADTEKTLECHEVYIKKTEAPVGKGIAVYYAKDTDEARIVADAFSMNDSKRYPVKIVENDITYTMKSISVAK